MKIEVMVFFFMAAKILLNRLSQANVCSQHSVVIMVFLFYFFRVIVLMATGILVILKVAPDDLDKIKAGERN